MEIKNKLTETRGREEGSNGGKIGKCQVKEYVQRTQGQGQWARDCLWEQRLAGWGRATGGKMETNITEKQLQKQKKNVCLCKTITETEKKMYVYVKLNAFIFFGAATIPKKYF